MQTTTEDPLGPLRQVLRRPDQRTWRRLLPVAQGAHRRTTPPPPPPPEHGSGDRPGQGEDAAGPRAWQVVAGISILAAGIVLGTGLVPSDSPRPHSDVTGSLEPSAPDAASPGSPTPPTDTAAVRVWPAERVEVAGRVLRTDAGRWEVGSDGDVVTVGDWDCDRLPTPAVLRPVDGRIVVFDRWASSERDERARAVASVAGATTLRPGRACGELVVGTTSGTETVVDTRGAPGGASS